MMRKKLHARNLCRLFVIHEKRMKFFELFSGMRLDKQKNCDTMIR